MVVPCDGFIQTRQRTTRGSSYELFPDSFREVRKPRPYNILKILMEGVLEIELANTKRRQHTESDYHAGRILRLSHPR